MELKTLTVDDIRSFRPCYDPTRFLPEDWRGTVIDILKVKDCTAKDRMWVVCREELIDARTLRLFAVWCARRAIKLIGNPDPRSVNACDIAERYANGDATDQELAAAWADALDAAWDAARDAALAAARATAWDAAWDAAWAAARAAAWNAARAADRAAARAAAWDAARDAQKSKFIEMVDAAVPAERMEKADG